MIQPGEMVVIVALAALVPLGMLAVTYFRGKRRRQKVSQDGEEESQRTRPMEFGSSFMFLGVWPTDTAMPEPIVTTFMYFDEAPDASSVEAACSKMLRFDNFRSLPQRCRRRWFLPTLTKCEWREIKVETADIITRVRVEGSAMVLREMERIKDSGLPQFSRDGRKQLPLWSLHVIENTDLHEGSDALGSVVVFRFHHTIGDGMSLVAVARDVLESVGRNNDHPPRVAGVGVGDALATGPRSDLKTFSRIGIDKTISAMREVVGQSLARSDTSLPFGHLEAPIARGRHGELWDPIPSGRIEGGKAFSGRRRIIIFPDISLSLIKALKERGGAKVNDVMICLFSGCIRRYCKAMGAESYMGGKSFQSRVAMPVALPRTMDAGDKAEVLCNRWGLASTPLHLEEEDPAIRLEKIKVTSAKMKETSTGGMHYLLQAHVMPRLPLSVCRTMVYKSLATHTLFLSNVPGPQEPTSFAGRRLRGIHFCFNNIMPHVGVISLDGAVGATLVVDPVAAPESLSLPSHYIEELKALMASLGVEDAKALEEAESRRDRMTRTMMQAADVVR